MLRQPLRVEEQREHFEFSLNSYEQRDVFLRQLGIHRAGEVWRPREGAERDATADPPQGAMPGHEHEGARDRAATGSARREWPTAVPRDLIPHPGPRSADLGAPDRSTGDPGRGDLRYRAGARCGQCLSAPSAPIDPHQDMKIAVDGVREKAWRVLRAIVLQSL